MMQRTILHSMMLYLVLSAMPASCATRKETNAAGTTQSDSTRTLPDTVAEDGDVERARDSHYETIRHGVRLYVSAVNCEMNVEDAARINALARNTGITVEVVFLGITNNDTTVARRAREDLTLKVPVRLVQPGEVDSLTSSWKSTGGASLPVALVIRGRQLKTIVAGESMPRTLSMIEAAWSTSASPAARLAAAAGTSR